MSTHEIAAAQPDTARSLLKSYTIGFVLSVILAIAAFTVVGKQIFSGEGLYFAIAILAISQLLVQVVYFLRLNTNTEDDRWNLICFVFSLIIIGIVVTGSLWIMYNLNYFMMH
ncbi:MAG: cytochrome o ubiquinol oxidase subunit IV [Gammaproteobacteria bacterium]|nr:cytochrome o ubiquinol oxidase subunit IV [Gammaproteobacteria bacterium]